MDTKKAVKATQDQITAAWIAFLKQLRIEELIARLTSQDINFENAIRELQAGKGEIASLILSNRGGSTGLHGFIAESAEVHAENARRLIKGLEGISQWINDNGPADFCRGDISIQQKFVNDLFSLGSSAQKGVYSHVIDYPWFVEQGGKYQVPKDFYEKIMKLRSIPAKEATKLTNNAPDGITRRAWERVDQFFKNTGLEDSDLEPSLFNYADVQKGKIGETLQKEEQYIQKLDQEQRAAAFEETQPALSEGVQAAAAGAALEGGIAFALAVHEKLKAGKKLHDFTSEDWKEVGLDTGLGTLQGGVRGASVYGLTNFTATPAPVASAIVTAIFGMLGQAYQLEQGNIDSEEFIAGTQVVCLEAGVSAVSSLIGQAVIPVPILGAIIGNAVGMIAYSIATDYLGSAEQKAISNYIAELERLNSILDERYKALIAQLKAEFERFKSLVEFAFDLDVNLAFEGSISLADYIGVDPDQVLRSREDIDHYYTD